MIGERLSELRKDKGMSQQELADRLSITKFTISSYEREKTMPSDEIKLEIAKIFDVSLDYLLGLIDEPAPYKRNTKCIYLPHDFPSDGEAILNLYIETLIEYYNKRTAR